MAEAGIYATGLREAITALRRVDREAAKEFRKELRGQIGAEFVRDTKTMIAAVGLVRSGRLRGSIRSAMLGGSTLVVRSSPPLKPGPRSPIGYAAVYEYGGRSGKRRYRPFMEPTLEAWQASGKLEKKAESFLDWAEHEFMK